MSIPDNLLLFFERPVFLTTIFLGIIFLLFSQFFNGFWGLGLATIGSSFLTIGITLPVALYYQIKSNAESFKIINTCRLAGIESIFVSRKRDSIDLRKSIADSVNKTNTISVLGIAFPTFFNASSESHELISERINSPLIKLRILLLDFDSEAAKRRANIEHGNATLDDIKYTYNNHLVAVAVERLKNIQKNSKNMDIKNVCDTEFNMENLRSLLNFEIRAYRFDPIVFLMIFDDVLFSEQYHFGHPDNIVPFGSCIGKYMPVIKYRKGSEGYQFLENHFKYIWKNSQDWTDELIKKACESLIASGES